MRPRTDLIKCSRCRYELPSQMFRDHGDTGKLLKTCSDCRGQSSVGKDAKRTCPGLPKSWGRKKCEAKVDSAYRCPVCTRLWKQHHRVIEGRFNGNEYGGVVSAQSRK